jgi:hypothetical protein
MSPSTRKTILHAADLLTRKAVALRQSHTVPGTNNWGFDEAARRDCEDMGNTAMLLHDIAFGVIE